MPNYKFYLATDGGKNFTAVSRSYANVKEAIEDAPRLNRKRELGGLPPVVAVKVQSGNNPTTKFLRWINDDMNEDDE